MLAVCNALAKYNVAYPHMFRVHLTGRVLRVILSTECTDERLAVMQQALRLGFRDDSLTPLVQVHPGQPPKGYLVRGILETAASEGEAVDLAWDAWGVAESRGTLAP